MELETGYLCRLVTYLMEVTKLMENPREIKKSCCIFHSPKIEENVFGFPIKNVINLADQDAVAVLTISSSFHFGFLSLIPSK